MVLVSILGDFDSSIFPIFFEFKEKLTHHIIVHDDSAYDSQHIKKIIQAQKVFKKTYEKDGINNLNYKISSIKLAEDNYEQIVQAFEMIISKTNNPKDIVLNATDGLSSIAIVLSNKLLDYGAKVVVYDRFSNDYNIHIQNSIKKKTIKNSIDIKNHLKLKGYKLQSWTNNFELKRRKKHIYKLTKNLPAFKIFVNQYPNENYNNKYINLINKLKIKEESFIKGGIFEEYIYWLIKDNIVLDDIMTGVTVDFNKDVKNEIDILIMKNNHLHTIECKFTSNFKTSEYLYKTDSIIDAIDDDGKGMILSIGDKTIGWQDEARAKNNNIEVFFITASNFNKYDFINAVCKFFDLKRI